MSALSNLLYRKFLGYPAVLPEHLRNWQGTGKVKLHTDWPWPLSGIPRSWNARGPRAGQGNPGYLPWPPRLIKGRGACRWETAGATSILQIPDLFREMTADQVYGKKWLCVERKEDHPDFGQTGNVMLDWHEAHVMEAKSALDGSIQTFVTPNEYSPSAIQSFSPRGYLKLSPAYHSEWKALSWEENGYEWDGGLFNRRDTRPDHLDVYYNTSPLKIGFVGLRAE